MANLQHKIKFIQGVILCSYRVDCDKMKLKYFYLYLFFDFSLASRISVRLH